MKLKSMLKKMWAAMEEHDRPDEWLQARGRKTREDIAFQPVPQGGITVVPCDMVYPFLYALATDERLSDIVKEIERDPEAYMGPM